MAVAVLEVFILTVQTFPASASQPVQLLKPAPGEGVGVSAIDEPAVNDVLHVPGQLIPAGALDTVPPTLFVTFTVKG